MADCNPSDISGRSGVSFRNLNFKSTPGNRCFGFSVMFDISAVCLKLMCSGDAICTPIKPWVYGSSVEAPSLTVPTLSMRALGIVFRPKKPVKAALCLCCVFACAFGQAVVIAQRVIIAVILFVYVQFSVNIREPEWEYMCITLWIVT